MRYFKRSIQGLVGQTEEQDELLARILHKELMDGICVKIADDIFLEGMHVCEPAVSSWKKYACYYAVRVFGRFAIKNSQPRGDKPKA